MKTQEGKGDGKPSRSGGRRRGRLWVIVLLLAIPGAAFVLAGWIRRPAEGDAGSARATFTAHRDELIVTVVETGGTPEDRQVQTGAFNSVFVEIVGGLDVGETVLLNPPRILEPKTESKTEEAVTAIAGR